MLTCRQCSLADERYRVVPGYGMVPARLMIVAQSPGAQEDQQGIPLVGKSGRLLSVVLAEVGIAKEDHYKTNINLCHPQDNRKATWGEQKVCTDAWLWNQVRMVDPDVIVTLGDAAYRLFLPDEPKSITQVQGSVFRDRRIAGRERQIILRCIRRSCSAI